MAKLSDDPLDPHAHTDDQVVDVGPAARRRWPSSAASRG